MKLNFHTFWDDYGSLFGHVFVTLHYLAFISSSKFNFQYIVANFELMRRKREAVTIVYVTFSTHDVFRCVELSISVRWHKYPCW